MKFNYKKKQILKFKRGEVITLQGDRSLSTSEISW